MMASQKRAQTMTSFVRFELYRACMKYKTTSVAFVVAMPTAMTMLNGPKFWKAAQVVRLVPIISARKMVT